MTFRCQDTFGDDLVGADLTSSMPDWDDWFNVPTEWDGNRTFSNRFGVEECFTWNCTTPGYETAAYQFVLIGATSPQYETATMKVRQMK